jgi:N-acetylmuramoyl-L-alanine amidase
MSLSPSRRNLLQLALGLAAAGLPSLAEAAVTDLQMDQQDGQTVVSLAFDSATTWRLTADARPARLLLHLPGTAWRGPARAGASGAIRAARWDAAARRLVLDLTGPVTVRRAARQGNRLVITLAPGTAPGFARLARGTIAQGRIAPGPAMASTASGRGTPAAAPPPQRGPLPLVVIDPGHGGKDPGTIGVSGTLEKRITLATALELKRQLEATGRCRVALTRGRDVFVSLDGRVEFARKREAALFMSLHADSAPGARGASVYTLSDRASDGLSARLAQSQNRADAAGGLRLPRVSPEVERILFSLVRQETKTGSARLARFAVESLGDSVNLLPNTHRQAAFAVLKAPDVPSVLVEMGFLSDRQDEAALNRAAHRSKVAGALAGAVQGWLARHQAGLTSTG